MAQKTQVLLTCDLDEGEVPAAETVRFGFDGRSYAFELCELHLEQFHATLGAYAAAARLADGRTRRSRAIPASQRAEPSGAAAAAALAEIREWARSNGWKVSDRGRVPGEVRAAFDAAHPRG